MILKFPDLNTLCLALMSGVLPRAVVQASVVAGFDEQRQLWVEFDASLARGILNEVRKLGVQSVRALEATTTAAFGSWLELVPLQADELPLERPEKKSVLFEFSSGEELTRIIFEILRLGNDRQSYRWLENDDGGSRALLRVIGPPYYSLLRALDRHGKASAPIAYIERAPQVWVELGQTHPFIDLIRPPKGQLLFLRAPQSWTQIEDAPFRDIYDVMEFLLPEGRVSWHDQPLADKVKIALTLKPGGPLGGAQMWVLRDDPVAELNRFVQNANEHLLTSLAFAVGDKDDRKTIVLRALHSRSAPPELILNATPYRSHLRLPNLFVPTGMQLHPPLRRDVVRKLLAEDTEHVVWLAPGDRGSFTPQSLPENAFRPLTDWIAYVLDKEREPLRGWMQAMHFDFEAFICDEDGEPQPKKPDKAKDKSRPNRRKRGDAGDDAAPADPQFKYVDKTRQEPTDMPAIDLAADFGNVEPNVLQQQLRALEEQFLALDGDLDVVERQRVWPEMAKLNAALGQTDDASLCWLAALWFQDKTPPSWADKWLAVEASPKLDALLSSLQPTVAELRALAAHIVWAAAQTSPPPALLGRLNAVQRFLEANEHLLPVRAVWLAWFHLVRLSRGDVLALARARDRLLERLFQSGLRPECDLPSFLRFSGQPVSQRYRGMRQWMTQLCELVHMWAEENGRGGATRKPDQPPTELSPPMKGYIDLLFAFGLARLGEHDACRQLLQRATENLREEGPVHALLLKAFEYRIRQAMEGKPHTGPLPDEHYREVKTLDSGASRISGLDRYAAERMQSEMRILEPDQTIDPYRHIKGRGEGLEKALAELTDLRDRNEIAVGVEALWQQTTKGTKGDPVRLRILREALNLGPRLNEDFSRKMLDRAILLLEVLPPPPGEPELIDQADLLEKALYVAGHFDRVEHVQPIVAQFKKLLQIPVGPPTLKAIVKTANKCFRGLRKLGMRAEIEDLMTWMGAVISDGRDLSNLDADKLAETPEKLQVMLELAGGWYYFKRDRQAEPVLAGTRAVLFKNVLQSKDQTALARSYVAALGQCPVEMAQARLEDLFTHLRGIRDSLTTALYYGRHQLELIESVIMAVTHDDFTLGVNARRWLEDDEFLVRKRIHNDVRALLGREH